jgi:hypothetical protein
MSYLRVRFGRYSICEKTKTESGRWTERVICNLEDNATPEAALEAFEAEIPIVEECIRDCERWANDRTLSLQRENMRALCDFRNRLSELQQRLADVQGFLGILE